MSTRGDGGNRLERALAAFLQARPATAADGDALLRAHPDLAELLAPMLDRGDTAAAGGGRVLGDFRLVRELGRGGMGIVHEAWQRSLDRRVAVKVLAPALLQSPAAVARFRREATAAGRLRHPHIVEVFGCGTDAGEHFIAMQFVDGQPLHDAAARVRTPAAAVDLAAQLADALAHAHAAGLVHRDVKPANVLVRADGAALLTDFGVARDAALPTLTSAGGFVGTVDYASPEQVRGEVVDARTDVWALGVILHELLTGAHPFAGPTREATLHRILGSEPPRLQGRPGITDDLAAVVDRALAKERARRYPSAAALLEDLRALQRGEGVSARLPTRRERLRRWARREPWRAVAAAALLLGVPALAGAGGYVWANAPRIAAAAAAERARLREELLGEALASAHDGSGREGLARLGPATPDDDLETIVVRALLHQSLGEEEQTRALLAHRTEPVAALVLGFMKPRAVRLDHPADAPDDPLECFVKAELMLTRRAAYGTGTRAESARIVDLAAKAVTLSAHPRLSYLLAWATGAETSGDRSALDTATAALARHFPDSEVALRTRARLLARFRPEEALTLVDAIDRRFGPSARNEISRGLALESLDRVDEALAANRRATELAPHQARGWANLGVMLRKSKRAADSVDALERALELEPRKATHWNLLGLSRRDAGDLEGAAAAFATALECSPDYAAPAQNLGNLRARAGDLHGALEMLQRAIVHDPANVAIVGNLADALARVGREQEALPHALRGAQLAPNDFIAQFNLARLALDLRLPRLALPAARRAAELRAGAANALEVLAEALLAQQPLDAPAALTAARAADAATGAGVGARVLLARALAASGDLAAARAELERARTEPRFPTTARPRLERALRELDASGAAAGDGSGDGSGGNDGRR